MRIQDVPPHHHFNVLNLRYINIIDMVTFPFFVLSSQYIIKLVAVEIQDIYLVAGQNIKISLKSPY